MPTCQCNAGDPVPASILDPFSGTATTGAVALALGRSYVGVDASETYTAQARQRLADCCPEAPAPLPPDAAMPLFNLKGDSDV